ncbi:MAG: hypothetical protein MZV70_07790 [Desulfobacterales bacterium]|nr:hypothetical protein [Desulfobacterales bacterium]
MRPRDRRQPGLRRRSGQQDQRRECHDAGTATGPGVRAATAPVTALFDRLPHHAHVLKRASQRFPAVD